MFAALSVSRILKFVGGKKKVNFSVPPPVGAFRFILTNVLISGLRSVKKKIEISFIIFILSSQPSLNLSPYLIKYSFLYDKGQDFMTIS